MDSREENWGNKERLTRHYRLVQLPRYDCEMRAMRLTPPQSRQYPRYVFSPPPPIIDTFPTPARNKARDVSPKRRIEPTQEVDTELR